MTKIFSYACRDYPGMEACPASFTAGSEAELWSLIELHATQAHGEDPAQWGSDDRSMLQTLIKTEER